MHLIILYDDRLLLDWTVLIGIRAQNSLRRAKARAKCNTTSHFTYFTPPANWLTIVILWRHIHIKNWKDGVTSYRCSIPQIDKISNTTQRSRIVTDCTNIDRLIITTVRTKWYSTIVSIIRCYCLDIYISEQNSFRRVKNAHKNKSDIHLRPTPSPSRGEREPCINFWHHCVPLPTVQ